MKKYDESQPASEIPFTKYVIVVPHENDRKDLMEAFEHIHYSDVNADYIPVNQLIHEYLDGLREPGAINNIVVDYEAYERLTKLRK